MSEDAAKFYISHILRPKRFAVKASSKQEVKLTVLILSSIDSDRKSICLQENGKNSYFNCISFDHYKSTIKQILDKYLRFEAEILSIDKAYEEDFYLLITKSFIENPESLEEKVNLFKLKKNLE